MIVLHKEMAFISNYIMEKEFFLPDRLRKAISDIEYQIKKRRIAPALAVHIVNNIYKKKYNIDYSKEFLWEKYRARKAHIANAKKEFKKWAQEMRAKSINLPNKTEKLCECGCGNPVKNPKSRFLRGHNINMRSKEEKEFYLKNMLDKRDYEKDNVVINVDFSSTCSTCST